MENLTGGTPPVRYLLCVVPCKLYFGENETAKFWLSVLTDLKNRGVKDILIICSDGLSGIKQAIESAFPNTVQQRCIVHLIKNSCKYLSIYYDMI